MGNDELYKLIQLTEFFITNYKYAQIALKQYSDLISSEMWLLNAENKDYQVIRISFSSADQYQFEKDRIDEYMTIFKTCCKNPKLLDIHINREIHNPETEPFDYLNINNNYADGVDLTNIFPDIYKAIHIVKNPNLEIKNLGIKLRKSVKKNTHRKFLLLKNPYFFTILISLICIVVYLTYMFMKIKYDDSSSIFVFLGAEYKTFTLGLKQFYRLFTYSFVHHDIIHLLFNLISLNYVGKHIEVRYGHSKFLLILFFSVIIGGLTQGAKTDNDLCVGMSAGIYGLFVVLVLDSIKKRVIDLKNLIPTLCINLFLNFITSTAWLAHIGGAIGGLVIYFYLLDTKNIYRLSLVIVLTLFLIFKYVTINEINNFYAGTDFNVLKIYEDLGLKQYANKLLTKLINVYQKYGG